MAAIKFPFTECRLDLIFRSLSILVRGFNNIESALLRYLSIAAPRAIAFSDLLDLGTEKEEFIRRPGTAGCEKHLPR